MKRLIPSAQGTIVLQRRGKLHGRFGTAPISAPDPEDHRQRWQTGKAIWLAQAIEKEMQRYRAEIEEALARYEAIREGKSLLEVLTNPPIWSRIRGRFEPLASVHSGFDPQEIEKVDVDAVAENGELLAEGLWVKASRLSFHPEDASVRLRFSHGIEMIKASEPDPLREDLAAELAECVFPESALIARNEAVQRLCAQIVGSPVRFVERLFYSNAPNGGAAWHEDVERGHLGVIYAQLAGRTAWLVASNEELAQLAAGLGLAIEGRRPSPEEWGCLLAEENEAALAALESPQLTKRAIEAGMGLLLEPGDLLLLPQQSKARCCWHAVFCADAEPGHALSFAIAKRG